KKKKKGGGIDLICNADIRWCLNSSQFSIKEVDVGLVADVGTFGRINKIVGNDSLLRELAYTARTFDGNEAQRLGFVSRVFETKEEMMKQALDLASQIALKSPIAIFGIKEMCNYALDHTLQDSLRHVRTWNGGMLQATDVADSALAFAKKTKPKYAKFKYSHLLLTLPWKNSSLSETLNEIVYLNLA
ncbi:hypothetical protein RFI_27873, partial [Reticulomyxa filosa]